MDAKRTEDGGGVNRRTVDGGGVRSIVGDEYLLKISWVFQ